MCVFADQVVRITAQIHKLMEAAGRLVAPVDDVRHVGGEDEGGAVPARGSGTRSKMVMTLLHLEAARFIGHSPLDVPEHLGVSQELPEVDVEHVSAGLKHDVVVVAVTDPQDVGGHAAAGARVDEVLHRLTGGGGGAQVLVQVPASCYA